MPLRDFMTAIATTERIPISSGESGDIATHLENVSVTPVMLAQGRGEKSIREQIGLQGTAAQLFETYTESHTHTDDSVEVTQIPDIEAGDQMLINGIRYYVRWAELETATSGFGETLVLFITESKRK